MKIEATGIDKPIYINGDQRIDITMDNGESFTLREVRPAASCCQLEVTSMRSQMSLELVASNKVRAENMR